MDIAAFVRRRLEQTGHQSSQQTPPPLPLSHTSGESQQSGHFSGSPSRSQQQTVHSHNISTRLGERVNFDSTRHEELMGVMKQLTYAIQQLTIRLETLEDSVSSRLVGAKEFDEGGQPGEHRSSVLDTHHERRADLSLPYDSDEGMSCTQYFNKKASLGRVLNANKYKRARLEERSESTDDALFEDMG